MTPSSQAALFFDRAGAPHGFRLLFERPIKLPDLAIAESRYLLAAAPVGTLPVPPG